MNKIFKVVWSKTKECYVVVSEVAKNNGGKKKVLASVLAGLAMVSLAGVTAQAADMNTDKSANTANQINIWANTLTKGNPANGGSSVSGSGVANANDVKPSQYGDEISIAIGGQNSINTTDATSPGSGGSGYAIGNKNKIKGNRNVALGTENKTYGDDSIAIGNKTVSGTGHGIAIGSINGTTQTVAYGSANPSETAQSAFGFALAIGSGAQADGRANGASGGIAIGQMVKSTNNNTVAIGVSTTASGNNAVAIGSGAQATQRISTAYGPNANANSAGGVAIGTDAAVGTDTGLTTVIAGATAVGANAQAQSTNGSAFGRNAKVDKNAENATALGAFATANIAGGVALGSNSVTTTAAGVQGYNPADNRTNKYSDQAGAIGTATLAAVSVGNGLTATRQITGVAAGTADTDAVNVAQLKNVNLKYAGDSTQVTGSTDVRLNDGTFNVNGDGTLISTEATATGIKVKAKVGGTINNTDGKAVKPTTNGIATTDNVADAINNSYWKATAGGNTDGTPAVGKVKPGTQVTYSAGDNLKVKQTIAANGDQEYKYSLNPVLTGITSIANTATGPKMTFGGNSINITGGSLDMGNNKITNLAPGTDDKDAVNVKQLKDTELHITPGTYTPDANKKVTLTYTNGNNTVVSGKEAVIDLSSLATGGTASTEKVKKAANGTNDTNIAEVNPQTGDTFGGAGATYEVSVSRNAVKDAAREAVTVNNGGTTTGGTYTADTNNPISVTAVPDNTNHNTTYAVTFDGNKAAKQIPLTYKATNGTITTADQTVKLDKGLNFTGGDYTTASVGADGKVTFDVNLGTAPTVTDGKPGVPGQAGAAGKDGIATVKTVVDTINNSGWKANAKANGGTLVGNSTATVVKPGDQVNFAAGKNLTVKQDLTGEHTYTYSLNKDVDLTNAGSLTVGGTKVNNDGITIKAPTTPGTTTTDVKLTNTGLDNGGNKIVNVAEGKADTDAVNVKQLKDAKTVLADGKNTKKSGTGTAADPYKVNVEGDLTGISSITNGGTNNGKISFGPNKTVTVDGDHSITLNASTGKIGGLQNLTFDPTNFTSGQAATEDQLKSVHDTLKASELHIAPTESNRTGEHIAGAATSNTAAGAAANAYKYDATTKQVVLEYNDGTGANKTGTKAVIDFSALNTGAGASSWNIASDKVSTTEGTVAAGSAATQNIADGKTVTMKAGKNLTVKQENVGGNASVAFSLDKDLKDLDSVTTNKTITKEITLKDPNGGTTSTTIKKDGDRITYTNDGSTTVNKVANLADEKHITPGTYSVDSNGKVTMTYTDGNGGLVPNTTTVIDGLVTKKLDNIDNDGKKTITGLGTIVKAGDNVTVSEASDATTGQKTYTVNAVTPAVYTKADGTKVVKRSDGTYTTNLDGSSGNDVAASDVIISFQDAAGDTKNATSIVNNVGSAIDKNGTSTGDTFLSNLKTAATNTPNAAVNVRDLKTTSDALIDKGLRFDANEGNEKTNKLGSKVTVQGSGAVSTGKQFTDEYNTANIRTNISQNNGDTVINVGLAKALKNINSISNGGSSITLNSTPGGATNTPAVQITGGNLSMGDGTTNNKIVNLAPGTADTDAVNVKQLKDTELHITPGTYTPGTDKKVKLTYTDGNNTVVTGKEAVIDLSGLATGGTASTEKVKKAANGTNDTNIAEVNPQTGDTFGGAGATYEVSVSRNAVKDAAREAVTVNNGGTTTGGTYTADTNNPISVTAVPDNTNHNTTYAVTFDGNKAAKQIPLTYKATNGTTTSADQTVKLDKGLNFTGGDYTTASVGADGKVTFDVTLGTVPTVTDGKPGVPGQAGAAGKDGIATVKTVVDTINNSGWKANAKANGGSLDGNSTATVVKPGDQVNFAAGKNLTVKQDLTGEHTYTYSLNKDLKDLTSVEIGGSTIKTDGDHITITSPDTTTGATPGATVTNKVANLGDEKHIKPDTYAVANDGSVTLKYVDGNGKDLTETTKITGITNQNLSNISTVGETKIKNLAKSAINMEDGKNTKASKRDVNGVDTYKVDVEGDLTGISSITNGGTNNGKISFGPNKTVTVDGDHSITLNASTGKIGGLQNKTFDPTNFTSGQAATEDQLKSVHDTLKANERHIAPTTVATGSTENKGGTANAGGTANVYKYDAASKTVTLTYNDGNGNAVTDTKAVIDLSNLSTGGTGASSWNIASDKVSATEGAVATGSAGTQNIADGKTVTMKAGKNLTVNQANDGAGNASVAFSLDKNLENLDKVVVNGNDGATGQAGVSIVGPKGANGVDGNDGKVGIAGKDGKDAVSISGKDGVGHIGLQGPKGTPGTPGADGANLDITTDHGTQTLVKPERNNNNQSERIVYVPKDANGNPLKDTDGNDIKREVATMDDGLKFAGDDGQANQATNANVIKKQLNNVVDIIGGATKADLTTNNIGVNNDGNGKLLVQLSKNLKGLNSIQLGGNTIQSNGDNITFTTNGGTTKTVATTDQLWTIQANGTDVPAKSGKVNLVAGDHITITPDAANGKMTISATGFGSMDGFNVKTSAESATVGTHAGDTTENIKNGKTVDMQAGKNLVVTQTNDGNGNTTVNYALNKDVDLGTNGSLKTGDTTINNDGFKNGNTTVGGNGMTIKDPTDPAKTVSLTKDGLNNGGNQITNVASGGNVDTNAANIGDIKRLAKDTRIKDGTYTVDNNGTVELTYVDGAGNQVKDASGKAITAKITGLTTLDSTRVNVAVNETGSGKAVGSTTPVKVTKGTEFVAGNNLIVERKAHTGNDLDNSVVYSLNSNLTGINSISNTATGPKMTFGGNNVNFTGGDVKISDGNLNMNNNKITHVANGTDDNDAVNVSQLKAAKTVVKDDGVTTKVTKSTGANGEDVYTVKSLTGGGADLSNITNKVDQLGEEIGRVGAQGAALSALKPIQYDPLEPTQIMAGYGNYRGNSAVALGVAHYKNESTLIHGGVSWAGGSSHMMANAGVTWKVGNRDSEAAVADRYRKGPISSAYAMQQEMAAMKAQNAGLKGEVSDLKAENEQMKAQIAAMMAKLGL